MANVSGTPTTTSKSSYYYTSGDRLTSSSVTQEKQPGGGYKTVAADYTIIGADGSHRVVTHEQMSDYGLRDLQRAVASESTSSRYQSSSRYCSSCNQENCDGHNG